MDENGMPEGFVNDPPVEKGKEKKRRQQNCTSCKNHKIAARKKGHLCPFKQCECPLCELQRKAQLTMRHQQRFWRHQKAKMRSGLTELEQTNAEEKGQVCDKCRNHNKKRLKKNHQCPFTDCKCDYCSLTFKRRELMKHLQRVRRSNVVTCDGNVAPVVPISQGAEMDQNDQEHYSDCAEQPKVSQYEGNKTTAQLCATRSRSYIAESTEEPNSEQFDCEYEQEYQPGSEQDYPERYIDFPNNGHAYQINRSQPTEEYYAKCIESEASYEKARCKTEYATDSRYTTIPQLIPLSPPRSPENKSYYESQTFPIDYSEKYNNKTYYEPANTETVVHTSRLTHVKNGSSRSTNQLKPNEPSLNEHKTKFSIEPEDVQLRYCNWPPSPSVSDSSPPDASLVVASATPILLHQLRGGQSRYLTESHQYISNTNIKHIVYRSCQ